MKYRSINRKLPMRSITVMATLGYTIVAQYIGISMEVQLAALGISAAFIAGDTIRPTDTVRDDG